MELALLIIGIGWLIIFAATAYVFCDKEKKNK